MDSLATGRYSYEEAVNIAKKCYKEYLESLINSYDQRIANLLERLSDPGLTAEEIDAIVRALTRYINKKAKRQGQLADPSKSWVRHTFKKYCEWKAH